MSTLAILKSCIHALTSNPNIVYHTLCACMLLGFITHKYNKKLGSSRDLALLSVLLWYLVLSTTSTCSITFYQCTTIPTLIENSQFFVILVCILFKLAYMWPNLTKPVFHTHPILGIRRIITPGENKPVFSNFHQLFYEDIERFREIFRSVALCRVKLQAPEVE